MNTRVANILDETLSVEARDRSAPAVALSDSLDGKTATINRIDGLMSEVGRAAARGRHRNRGEKCSDGLGCTYMTSKSFKLPA